MPDELPIETIWETKVKGAVNFRAKEKFKDLVELMEAIKQLEEDGLPATADEITEAREKIKEQVDSLTDKHNEAMEGIKDKDERSRLTEAYKKEKGELDWLKPLL